MNDGRRGPAGSRRRIPLLGVALLLAGCQLGTLTTAPTQDPNHPLPAKAELDPASPCVTDPDPANGGHPAPPALLAANDSVDPSGVVGLRAVGLGDVVLPSDKLLVADLFAMAVNPDDLPAIDLGGQTGRFPVCLHVAQLHPADERVAFLHVRFSTQPVVRWADAPIGFGVDGGTGGIGSAEAVSAATIENIDGYLAAIEAHDVPTWNWANVTTDAATGANVIGFSTGYGDGGYPVFVGLDKDGRVASVVVDLLVAPWRWLGEVGSVGGPRSSGMALPQALSPRAAIHSS